MNPRKLRDRKKGGAIESVVARGVIISRGVNGNYRTFPGEGRGAFGKKGKGGKLIGRKPGGLRPLRNAEVVSSDGEYSRLSNGMIVRTAPWLARTIARKEAA